MSQMPRRLFEYTDYREYLRDYYQHAKSTRSNFSFRLFSRLCNFKSSNFLMLVMNGKSRLSSVSVEKVIKGIKLNKEEAHFFRNLVGFNEAKTTEQRAQHAREMLKLRSYKEIFPLSDAQYKYLGDWHLPVIRSAIGLSNFNQSAEWIANHITPKMDVAEVEAAIEELLKLGLITRDENNKLHQSNSMVVTPNEVTSSFAAEYHRHMLQLAAESIDRFSRDKRHLAGLTIAVDAQAIVKIKEITEKYRNEIMDIALNSTDAKAIYQVGIQTFPLFQSKDSEPESE